MSNYTSDICTGGTAASDAYAASYLPAGAFNDVATYSSGSAWEVVTSYPHWISYDLGSGVSKCVAQYTIQPYSVYFPTAWKFQGSNNNTDWTDLDTQTGQSFSSSEKKTYNSFLNSTYYRYYRWYFTGGKADLVILELEAMELMYPDPACYLHARRDRLNMKPVSTQNSLE